MNSAAAAALEMPWFGARVIDAASTRFTLWAPDATRVELLLDGREPIAMEIDADGCARISAACGQGTRYRYRVVTQDGALDVPDPAARAQSDGVHGWSLVIDPQRYAWRHADWPGRPWHETVLYELHAGALGGFEGVSIQLARLKALGITAIELMPIAAFPGARNWGYDGVLPYAVQASYGSPDELKALIDEAHGLGLMVFLDVVYNHFGPDGNYLHAYAKCFFREDVKTPWGSAIDFRKPQVRRFFIDNALMWLFEYRLDGLRFDAVHAIGEQDFLEELAETIRRATPAGRHVHLVLENEANHASLLAPALFDAQWNDDWHNVMHVLLTDEHEGYYADFTEHPTPRLARCLSEGFVYQGEPSRHGTARGEQSGHLPPTAFVAFLQNHDQIGNRALGERLSVLADPDALAAATLLLLLSPMVPLLFMGEEWGSTRPFLFFTDHDDTLADAVREGRRAEFADFAAFKDDQARARIPDPNARESFDASIPDPDMSGVPAHREILERYRHLLALRHRHIVPRLDGARALGAEVLGDKAVLARWQLGDDTHLVIAVNLSDAETVSETLARLSCQALLFESRDAVARSAEAGRLPARAAAAWLMSDARGVLS
ncbi:malto-oligosyltrehalose trehalohydrolase [Vreelandella malpeensis]|uniref:Malto-oligosyltrehalose trehalohydrolase n=1 Tax=Vreelandella malpeensis TaxID=1172368 RepID=A0ABS8DRL9_9GAMM|nr:malto-oligosyltrehalose trehalohydrolase [Halomonas malpeensis]MCB8888893.1 malto-oligosyltrehalose trehalohydrolase [Halomonas malpeensis]